VTVGFPSCRLVLVVMGFFAFFNCYTLRVNLSVAIVEMVNATYQRELEVASVNLNSSSEFARFSHDVCVADDNTTHTDHNKVRIAFYSRRLIKLNATH